MWTVLLSLALAETGAPGTPTEAGVVRQLRIPVTVRTTLAEAWRLWTTPEGVTSFFAPGCHIELKVDGAYEIYFDPSAPPGQRGADGMRLLAVEPERRLVFTWNAPRTMPKVRDQRTVVEVTFDAVGPDSVRVTLTHSGWGTGAEWDAAFTYFDGAWNGFVMPAFVHRVTRGPIDWKAARRLDLTPILPTAAEILTVARQGSP